jgi:hypothetical protein
LRRRRLCRCGRRFVGPSFELFYEDDDLLPHRESAWALLEERLRDASSFCAAVTTSAPDDVASALAVADGTPTAVADSLAQHLADWGATSRFLTAGGGATTATATRCVSPPPLVPRRRLDPRRRHPRAPRGRHDALRRSLAPGPRRRLPPLDRRRQTPLGRRFRGRRHGPPPAARVAVETADFA